MFYRIVCKMFYRIVPSGFTAMNKNFHNVSLGQGQEVVAEEAMAIAATSKSQFNRTISRILQEREREREKYFYLFNFLIHFYSKRFHKLI